MLYTFRFTLLDHKDIVQQVDEIVAPTPAEADYLYKNNIYNHLHESKRYFVHDDWVFPKLNKIIIEYVKDPVMNIDSFNDCPPALQREIDRQIEWQRLQTP